MNRPLIAPAPALPTTCPELNSIFFKVFENAFVALINDILLSPFGLSFI